MNRDSGTASANHGWLRRLVRRFGTVEAGEWRYKMLAGCSRANHISKLRIMRKAYNQSNHHTTMQKKLTCPERQRIRGLLVKRDGLFCHWCGCDLNLDAKQSNPFFATIEHLVPRSEGGSNNLSNLGLACRPCNHSHAGAKSPNDRS